MKAALFILTVLGLMILAVALAPLFKNDPGYVLIQFQDWNAETSVLVLLLAMVAVYLLIRLAVWLWYWPTRTARQVRELRAQRQLEKGLLALTEGDWRSAEKALSRSGNQRGQETVKYLAAARAAQGQDDIEGRDAYLSKAEAGDIKSRFLVQLSRARFLIGNGDIGGAIPILEALQKRRSRHPQVLEMLSRCYRELGDWQHLRKMIPALKKAGLIQAEDATELEQLAAKHELDSSNDIGILQERWRKLSTTLKNAPGMAMAFATRAIDLGAPSAAEPVLRTALKREWQPSLVRLYGHFAEKDLGQRISQCEKWLKTHPDDAALHLVIGQLCYEDKLWGKAREHLRTSLKLEASPDAFESYGRLLQRHGEIEAAMQCYQNALLIKAGKKPVELPENGTAQAYSTPRLEDNTAAKDQPPGS